MSLDLSGILRNAPGALAIVSRTGHNVLFANAAFVALPGATDLPLLGRPVSEVVPWAAPALVQALDRAAEIDTAVCEHPLGTAGGESRSWSSNVWPATDATHGPVMVVDMHPSTTGDATMMLQREVAQRLLLTALRETDSAVISRGVAHRATFLAAMGERLAESLDPVVTEQAIARLGLPHVADWCIVDIIGDDGLMKRLAVAHRDPHAHILLESIQERWPPHLGDLFGVPAILDNKQPLQVATNVEGALDAAGYDPDVRSVLKEINIGALLTTPMLVNGNVFGAITFVASKPSRRFSEEDIALSRALARRSALALMRARRFAGMLLVQQKAEAEAEITSTFLRTIGHEVRTPLQAIAGYAEIIAREIHGPVTSEQRVDLERILASQRHVSILVSELIDYVRSGSVHELEMSGSVSVDEAIAQAYEVVEPLILNKELAFTFHCDGHHRVRADEIKLHQILINLLANAVKFTDNGGKVEVTCERLGDVVTIAVNDTGRGIDPYMLERVFDPYVQAQQSDSLRGLGLGLSISRDLARRMNGNISVTSEPGVGSTFALMLAIAD